MNNEKFTYEKYKCDQCDKPATHWFGMTSAVLCDSSECYDKMNKEFYETMGYPDEYETL